MAEFTEGVWCCDCFLRTLGWCGSVACSDVLLVVKFLRKKAVGEDVGALVCGGSKGTLSNGEMLLAKTAATCSKCDPNYLYISVVYKYNTTVVYIYNKYHICVYVCIYAYIHVCICVYTYIYICAYISIYMYIIYIKITLFVDASLPWNHNSRWK